MPQDRYAPQDITVCNINNNSYLGVLKNMTLSVDVESADARGLKDVYKYPWAIGRGVKFEGTQHASDLAPSLLAIAALGTARVTYAVNFGNEGYTGTALITSASRKADMGALQEVSFTLECQGAPTAL